MDPETVGLLGVFAAVAGLATAAGLALSGRRGRLSARLEELSGKAPRGDGPERPEAVAKIARAALPKLGKVIVPEDEGERNRLAARFGDFAHVDSGPLPAGGYATVLTIPRVDGGNC